MPQPAWKPSAARATGWSRRELTGMKLGMSSIVVRQALVSTVIMLVAIAALGYQSNAVVTDQIRANLMATIDTDIAGLTDGMVVGGVGEVARRIADRAQLGQADGAAYRLVDSSGAVLAGGLRAVPLDAQRSQSGEITSDDGVPLLARSTRLRGGYSLTVARSLATRDALTGRMTALFLSAAVPAALLSLLGAGLVARHFGRRVGILNSAFRRFEGGERSARAGLPPSRDELATLGGHVDLHLARIETLVETQREISDNIAHELRTPLGHLDARLLRALALHPDDAVQQELSAAREDIRSVVSLFDALLDLALAESKTARSGEQVTFDLSERIADLSELYAASAEEAGIAFTTRIAPAVTMRGEPMAMTRVAANLLDNAIKFAPAGSQVRLTLSPGPQIIVEDNGPGVDPADREQIFRRFRGARGSARGHGLGLALVRVIAVRHGLVARFEDARPGARFIIAPENAA